MTPDTTTRPTARLRIELAKYQGRAYRYRLTITAVPASGAQAGDGDVICIGWHGTRALAERAGRGFCEVNGYDVVEGG